MMAASGGWEYRLVSIDASGWFMGGKLDVQALTDHLNALGRDGWELVSVFDTNMAQGMTRTVVAALKRPRS